MVRLLSQWARCVFSRASLRLALVALWLGVGTAQHVEAQSAPGKAQQQQYKRVLDEAMAEYERSNWAEARSLFEAAHELSPTARTLRAIGMCAFEEKSYVMAIKFLGDALTDTRKPLTAEQRKQTEDALWRAREFVAKYRLNLTPIDATVRIDGHEPMLADGQLLLDPGNHRLTVSASGYVTSDQTIGVRAREAGELVVTLLVEGAAVASTEPTPPPAPEEAPAASTGAPPVDEPKGKLTKLQWVGVGLSAFGAAALGVGIGFGVDAKNKHDRSDCTDTCETEADKKLNDQALTSAHVSTAMFVAGGVSAAAGIFLAVWGREKKPSTQQSLRFAPALAQGFVGGTARGVW